MARNTAIAWTDHTFNPWIGCTKVSPGCAHCYAEADTPARVFGVEWGPGRPRHRTADSTWQQPRTWHRAAIRTGRRSRVFCASLSDVFDAEVPPTWRSDLWELIRSCDGLDWLLLTKRPENIAAMLPPNWGNGWDHVWLGTSAEDQTRLEQRWPHLRAIPAAVRFVSAEPLLGPLDLAAAPGLDWIITGGESGPAARPAHLEWFRSIRDQCLARGIACFHKQNGGTDPAHGGHALDGQTYQQWPASISGQLLLL